MIQFLNPIWLFALAGLAIPVIIHLWNEKEGKTLQVGSIRLLTSSSRQNARSLKLMDLLLLLLRCLLILMLSFLLAGPVWHQSVIPGKQKGWVVVEKAGLRQTYMQFQTSIDSLSRAGFEFHYFNPGFTKANLAEILKSPDDTASPITGSYWMLLGALDQAVPPGLPVYLFTTNKLGHFRGTRPAVSMNLKWLSYTPADSISTGPARAYLTPSDSIRLVSAESRPSGYFYKSAHLSPAEQRNRGQMVSFEGGKLAVSMNAGGNPRQQPAKIEVDTATLRMTIFEDNSTNDGWYVKAVLEAFRQFSKRKINVVLTKNEGEITGDRDWLFWLSSRPLQRHGAANIFRYENGRVRNVHSWLRTGIGGLFEEPVALHKLVRNDSVQAANATSIWKDGFGNAVLDAETKNNSTTYRFFSRFDPAWNDLVWSKEFPAMMLQLLEKSGPKNEMLVDDQRIIDPAQIDPVFVSQDTASASRRLVVDTDLSPWFWAAAFLFFLAERLISFNKKKEKRHG